LPGARAIVFGASGALGRVVAAALARAGARVGLTYFQGRAVADELCARLDGAVARRLDLTVTADIPRVLDDLASALGGVDAFVHCAALLSTTSAAPTMGETPKPPAQPVYDRLGGVGEAGFDRLFAVNVRSAFFAAQHLATLMSSGNLVLVAGVDSVKTVPAPIPYAAAGGAVVAMARALAKDLGPKNLRVNVVAAGVLDAGLSAGLPADLRAQYLKHCGLRRVGRREEIAELVAFLALENTYVTGQAVVVDGGL
jgi:NAD(P)-dependent dehydrogenase (short-subunit alcohol dehydrogenase family)